MGSSKRKRQAKHKFLQASNTLKRKLEASYEISLSGEYIEEQDPEPQKRKDDELAGYHALIESIKDKFTASQSYPYHEKLQILTLSPPFTIEETQCFFQASDYMVKKSKAEADERNYVNS